MGFWRAIARGRIREDRGAYAILFAILVIVLFAFVALVVDLGQTRAVARTNQSVADLALLSGGQLLTNPQAACNAAWKNLQHNITDKAIPDAASPCPSMPTSLSALTSANGSLLCSSPASSGASTRAARIYQANLALTDPYTIFFVYPVANDDPEMVGLNSGDTSLRNNDGNPCTRMALSVRTRLKTLFGGILGAQNTSAVADAVVRGPTPGGQKVPAALIILDPTQCRTLTVSGQGTIRVSHIGSTPGIIAIDSGPTSACSGASNQYVMHVDGGANAIGRILADGINAGSVGIIEMYNIGAPGCSTLAPSPPNTKACDPTNFSGSPPSIVPPPISETAPVTPEPWWWRYNCQTTTAYSPYHGQAIIPPCPGVTDPVSKAIIAPTDSQFINNLVNQVGRSQAKATVEGLGFKDYLTDPDVRDASTHASLAATAAARCGPTVDVQVGVHQVSGVWTPYSANWYVDCPNPNASTQGFDPNGQSVTFYQGNLVFAGGVSVKTGSTLNINCPLSGSCDPAVNTLIDGTNYGYPSSCITSDSGATCIGASSPAANWVYLRTNGTSSSLFTDSGNSGATNLYYSSLYIESAPAAQGALVWGAGGSTTLHWYAPLEGPFRNLALWSEGAALHTLKGAAGIIMEGIFFAPNALPFQFSGQADFGQTRAQFVTYDMDLSGQGTLTLSPDPNRIEDIPFFGTVLIR